MERQWKLDEDLSVTDNILDGLTFDELILTVHCNCREKTEKAVRKELKEIVNSRLEDMYYLLENNIGKIIEKAEY